MANILLIESSARACSVALSHEFAIAWHASTTEGPNHASQLGVYVEDALTYAREHDLALDAVAVSAGPGSYTGLRIGVSEAKGLCFGLGVPLIAVPTLEVLATHVLLADDAMADDAVVCPLVDARRMEVYTAVYDRALREVRPLEAVVVDATFRADLLGEREVCFVGDAVAKCATVVTHPNARFVEGVVPMADDMLALAVKAYNAGRFADVAYFTPLYLKEFVATKPNLDKILK